MDQRPEQEQQTQQARRATTGSTGKASTRQGRSSSSASMMIKYLTGRVSRFGQDTSNHDDRRASTSSLPVVVNDPPSKHKQKQQNGGGNGDDEEIPLPHSDNFTWATVVSNVDAEYTAVKQSLAAIVSKCRTDLTQELDQASQRQNELTSQMELCDGLCVRVLKQAQRRLHTTHQSMLAMQSRQCNLGRLEQSAQQSRKLLGSIVSLLQDIDALLPPQDRLSDANSPHRRHYPHLHELLQSSSSSKTTSGTSISSHTFDPDEGHRAPRRTVSMSALALLDDEPAASTATQDTDTIQDPHQPLLLHTNSGVGLRRPELQQQLQQQQQGYPDAFAPRNVLRLASDPLPPTQYGDNETGSVISHDEDPNGNGESAQNRLRKVLQSGNST